MRMAARRGNPRDGNGCANRQSVSHSSDDHEQVQTARLDCNIDAKNTAWFRFQADTGVQAAYTDPINPVFDAVSPQPLYSFAAGYTHVFSQNLVNYFNPAFSWYGSLFAPNNFQQTLAAFPIVLQGRARTLRSPRSEGWTTPGRRDGERTRVSQRQSGLEPWGARIPLRNQYPNLSAERLRFRRGQLADRDLRDVAAIHLRRGFHRHADFSPASNEPFNFLNLDLYAQDTWKVTPKVTWTFGMRDASIRIR